ncbi:reverse transcriptase [Gossypium australe]|uniref:Reverse transcriptase n=1 Tax=Gossypium australe TaxID=47621 RepID=A0A5B6W4Y0_9ROSI|nr:reverse transcriptase [Gossypium australe]
MDVHSLNVTNIVLIPKVLHPTNLGNFRPISLCNVLYKVVAKMIVNRLKEVLKACIDSAQSAFVPGRLISDNVLLTREWGKKFMAVKFDMSKAYDRVELQFLRYMMIRIGFDFAWISTVMKCVSSISYSVVVNRNVGKIFKPTREIRQGDPLSLFLFLIYSEGLSALMRLAMRDGLIKGAKASTNGPQISYLLFADYCILFGEANVRGAQTLKSIVREYERCSGQCVNFEKSTVLYSSNTLEVNR